MDSQEIVSMDTWDLNPGLYLAWLGATKYKIKPLGKVIPLTKVLGAGVVGQGPIRGFTWKKAPMILSSTRGCTLDVTKYKIKSLGKSPLSMGRLEGGQGYHW